jgi:hypothetical protein
MPTAIRAYIRSLGIDAYVVGGAVRDELLGIPHRDEDFLVPGVDQAGLRALLEPHGHVEDMEVHGQLVGVRLHPRDRSVRALVPSGIDLTPPRAERSTGPGHRDFAIVSDATIGLEEDMARRDFTINAMARRLEDGSLLDPFGGVDDLERADCRRSDRRASRMTPSVSSAPCGSSRSSTSTWHPRPWPRCTRQRLVSRTSRRSGSAAESRPTPRESSRSCSWAGSRPVRSSWRAIRASSRA